MYEIATFVLYVHNALMALSFINGLLVFIQKKNYPYFHIKVISKIMLVLRAKVTTSNSII